MRLIFATNNTHKTEEIRALLPREFSIVTLKEAGVEGDIPEPHDTLQDNASEKARTVYALTHTDCFSDDTGLEVYALNNEPGVHSARYAGEGRSFEQNIDKLLQKMANISDRSARFRAVICLILNGEEHYFEGICEGKILTERKGGEGFGYDPVFLPLGADKSFAEMSMEEKNTYSHRGKAVAALVAYLKELSIKDNN
ncbi:MAG TPA: RdgB/HAM1 family non-canonical purine NTP pyrophosphatase [Flavisolibacter sp.]|nr:RdgB/HAM1 family non-canonical purine NTP pyrophosphatase [Flavisolibacter sp.]